MVSRAALTTLFQLVMTATGWRDEVPREAGDR
jgi:hypothetical protein